MVVPKLVRVEERKLELEKKYDVFRSAELVITDRLHGMIFAAITSTPCIAIDNVSGKVKGVYAWINQLSYISFIDHSIEDMRNEIEIVINADTESPKSFNKNLINNFKQILDIIKK